MWENAFAAPSSTAIDSMNSGIHQGNDMGFFVVLGIFFAVFYMLVIRPQKRRAKEHRALLKKLSVGDEVVTHGGIFGFIKGLDNDLVTLEIAKGVEIKLQKSSVADSKGRLKAI